MEKRKGDFNYRLWRYDGKPGELIPLLQSAQDHFGYIPLRAIKHISSITKIPESTIYGVITFYSQFRLSPMGKNVIKLCCGTACHVSGATMLSDTLQDELGIEVGGTTEDGLFSIFTVACLGCCSLAPVMMINDETYGKLTPASIRKTIRKIRREATKLQVNQQAEKTEQLEV
ncbi:MAG: NADH-quinone oxidoreductase subunit NuoE [bacterium]|nr:NADH-quinone oxidoreductase subunit NuoE [bacterium]MBU1918898.1 NADH-quinone oxidoreductase subunit NuoE [bacterium]